MIAPKIDPDTLETFRQSLAMMARHLAAIAAIIEERGATIDKAIAKAKTGRARSEPAS